MPEEIDALEQNRMWDVVPRHKDMNIVGNKWVYRTTLKVDGSRLDRLKARLVAKGYNQVEALNFAETFSPVIKPRSICLVLTIATMNRWDIELLDEKNAFLQGYFS